MLTFSLPNASALGEGVWLAKLDPNDVRRLGVGWEGLGKRSIVLTSSAQFNSHSQTLNLLPDLTRALVVGDSNDLVIIDSKISDPLNLSRLDNDKPAQMAEDDQSKFRIGDQEFFAACQEHLGTQLMRIIQPIVATFRSNNPGKMKEGKARKWVNDPDNFVAITIQNRDKSFAVYVKGRPEEFDVSSIEMKPDRPGYSRFKLWNEKQSGDAIKAILQSARPS